MKVEGLLFSALRFSDHPRARVISIDTSAATQTEGVIRVFTASDIPGERFTGLIISDWPLMIAPGEITRYIGDVVAGVVAIDDQEVVCRVITTRRDVLGGHGCGGREHDHHHNRAGDAGDDECPS